MNNKQLSRYFLPYQIRWLKDDGKIKIWEKSRRIGATYIQSFEDVEDCVKKKVPSVWFSSADESAAKEYIEYCAHWSKLFNTISVEYIGDEILDEDKDISTKVIRFNNGTKIYGLSSNPKQFRSKGGKVVLDEFGFHENAGELWKAARPVITWGFPLRILSTHNGKTCKYFQFVEDVKRKKLSWNLHTTPIHLAVKEGLADKITGRKLTSKERLEWIEEERKNCGDENTWKQEYCCIPVDETSAFLTYDLIRSCERDNLIMPLEDTKGDLFVGFDIARKKHFSVIWILEKLGRVKYTRSIIVMKNRPFSEQRDVLFKVLSLPNVRRCCIDASGLGMQLAEEAQVAFGKYKVEAIMFTAKSKEEIAYTLLKDFEDGAIYIPPDQEVREDLHSIKKIVTKSGNIRFDVADNLTAGHADRFWAAGLADHADSNNTGPIIITSRKPRRSSDITFGY